MWLAVLLVTYDQAQHLIRGALGEILDASPLQAPDSVGEACVILEIAEAELMRGRLAPDEAALRVGEIISRFRIWQVQEGANISHRLAPTPRSQADEYKWDFYIAYSSEDRSHALELHRALSLMGNPFLDKLCLGPGEIWSIGLEEQLRSSRAMVALMSSRVSTSWWVREEYLLAIELARKNRLRIHCILMEGMDSPPFGFAQTQAIHWKSGMSADKVVSLLFS